MAPIQVRLGSVPFSSAVENNQIVANTTLLTLGGRKVTVASFALVTRGRGDAE